jgi:hypothetical protein
VTPEPSEKRKTRIVRAIIIGSFLVGALSALIILRAGRANSGPAGQMFFSKTSLVCLQCGALMASKSRMVFGREVGNIDLISEPLFSPLGVQPCNQPCNHEQLHSLGGRDRMLILYPFTLVANEWGFQNGTFFSSAPALKEALLSVANTNLEGAQILLLALTEFRRRPISIVTNVLPALSSQDSALLKSQLLSPPFFNAVSSTLTNREFSSKWQRFEAQNFFQQ